LNRLEEFHFQSLTGAMHMHDDAFGAGGYHAVARGERHEQADALVL